MRSGTGGGAARFPYGGSDISQSPQTLFILLHLTWEVRAAILKCFVFYLIQYILPQTVIHTVPGRL
jgi:hypothetical protein